MSKCIIKVAGLVVAVTLMGFSIADASLLKDSALRRVKSSILPQQNPMAFNLDELSKLRDLPDSALTGKVVFVRPDFNEPTKDGKLLGDNRIKAGLGDIQYLISKGAKVVIGIHFGRPGGKVDPLLSTAPVAKRLGELLGKEVKFVDAAIGSKVSTAVDSLKNGEVLMLENLRFYPGEQNDDEQNSFALKLAESTKAQVYVNLASGNLNSEHKKNPQKAEASMGPITTFIDGPHVIGNLVVEELQTLVEFMQGPAVLGIFGGVKVADKIGALKNLLEKGKFKQLAFGGGMGTTFLATLGVNVAKSVYDNENVVVAKEILDLAARKGIPVYLPSDVVLDDGSVLTVLNAQGQKIADVPAERAIKTIGPKTTALYKELIVREKNRLGNGTMGQNELEQFAGPDNAIADALIDNPGNTLYIGGEGATSMVSRLESRGVQGAAVGIKTLTAGGSALDALAGKTLNALNYIDLNAPTAPVNWAAVDRERDVKNSLVDLIGSGVVLQKYNVELSSASAEAVKAFGEAAKEGEIYFNLKQNGKTFAYAKLRAARGNTSLVVAPVKEIAADDTMGKSQFYSDSLSLTMFLSQKTGRAIDLVMAHDSAFRGIVESRGPGKYAASRNNPNVLEQTISLGNIKGTNYLYGEDRFFQGEYQVGNGPKQMVVFKRSTDPLAGEDSASHFSLLVLPRVINIAINGYGTIGVQAADNARELGFKVIGVAKGKADDVARTAIRKGYTIYTYDHALDDKAKARLEEFKKAGIPVAGILKDLLNQNVELVVDASDSEEGGMFAHNAVLYDQYPNLKQIGQGGEKANNFDMSFTSTLGVFSKLLEAKKVRVVSCNTTALGRTFGKLYRELGTGIKSFIADLERRSGDPGKGEGRVDSMLAGPGPKYIPDVLSTAPYLSQAEKDRLAAIMKVNVQLLPFSHFHLHNIKLQGEGITVDKVKALLANEPRIALIQMPGAGFDTAKLYDNVKNLITDNNRGYLVFVQVDSLGKDMVQIYMAVPQEDNVIPENGTAYLGMFGLTDFAAATRIADEVLWVDWLKQAVEARMPAKK
jgi:phosphoglycerate kinase